jgi:hypothetical protein
MNQIRRHTVFGGNESQSKVTSKIGLMMPGSVDGIKEVRSYEGPMLTFLGGDLFTRHVHECMVQEVTENFRVGVKLYRNGL